MRVRVKMEEIEGSQRSSPPLICAAQALRWVRSTGVMQEMRIWEESLSEIDFYNPNEYLSDPLIETQSGDSKWEKGKLHPKQRKLRLKHLFTCSARAAISQTSGVPALLKRWPRLVLTAPLVEQWLSVTDGWVDRSVINDLLLIIVIIDLASNLLEWI